ncbi:hypothetical protein GCM10009715_42520 [Paeniglutamicibacter psychrophenolicus]|uniref:DUF4190 domain-containing protein n=1 Tax=Paeniglutamicibacter psychrophenolicus TaxID=257454 RepID=A0ABS4WJ72_9MICC|nr:DUF308 domain-containing protein [Paeniglutamicibacter psychrophenolicus]MBP2376245.1 hypothetical protein [Paeniglutamicibacter psychrophenolicus]
MSDPYARPGGDPSHGSWPAPGGYPGQYARNQQPYPGHYQGAYPGQYPPQGHYGTGGHLPPRTHGMTVFAMVTGIVAAVLSLVPFVGFVSFVLGPLAMVLGIVGIARRISSRGFSVTALVTGTFALLVSILYAVLFSTMLSYFDNTQSFEFSANGTGEYEVTVAKTADPPETATLREPYAQTVEASTLFGGITATNPGGSDEDVSCRIHDTAGNLLVEDSQSGPHAVAVCELSDVLVRKVEDIQFPDQVNARELD